MSWIAQYKDPLDGSWKEEEFDDKIEADIFIRPYEKGLVYHS